MSGADANRSTIQERRGLPVNIRRMMGLTTASELLGQAALAEAMGIDRRTLRYKISGERGVSDEDLTLAAGALEANARRIAGLADKLRAEIAQESVAA
jgi:transcriptional regulator with XRE-family HTH domain